MKKPEWFDEIKEKARDLWDNENRESERNVDTLFIQQIADIRYVISELLQNADDAEAEWASVKIENNTFIFEHNGHDFTKEEFASLCNFGVSNKRTCKTIGFRGIGFKSTFSLGKKVCVRTPTLAVYFLEDRFTEPVWDDDIIHQPNCTRISVDIDSDDILRGITSSFDEWKKSNYSLLFFKNLKELKIENLTFKVTSAESGPLENSQYLSLYSTMNSLNPDVKVLKISSELSNPPENVIAEVKKVRKTSKLEEVPSFVIDIILGIPKKQQCLYVVLPTLTQTNLNVSINAPFLLTPDRKGITNPSQSPTNRWILKAVGKLLVTNMEKWLNNTSLPLDKRVEAYGLLQPKTVTETGDKYVIDEFTDYISKVPLVMDIAGEFNRKCRIIPQLLYPVWENNALSEFYGSGSLPIIKEEAIDYKKDLKSWDLCEEESHVEFLSRFVNSNKIPKPESYEQIFKLWACISKEYNAASNNSVRKGNHDYFATIANLKEYHLFPVFGDDYLHSANDVLRPCPSLTGNVPKKYQSLIDKNLIFVDENFNNVLSAILETDGSANQNPWYRILDEIDMVRDSKISDIIYALSRLKFENIMDSVTLAHMCMYWDEAVPVEYFDYVSSNGNHVRIKNNTIYYDKEKVLEKILPTEERKSKILHQYYESTLETDDEKEMWENWILSKKSRVDQPFKLNEDARGNYYLSEDFVKLLESYSKSNPDDTKIWTDSLKRILESDKDYHKKIKDRKGNITQWVELFSRYPSIVGDDNKSHYPFEVYWKNEDTILLDDEIFTHNYYDEVFPQLLEELGVLFRPGYPKSLLKRLSELSRNNSHDIKKIKSEYQKLDKIYDKTDKVIHSKIREFFEMHRAIFTENETWAGFEKVYQKSTDIPDTYVINPEISDLHIWKGFEIPIKPSFNDRIGYLNKLRINTPLSEQQRKFIIPLLKEKTRDVLNAVKCWISLDYHWRDRDDFLYYLTDLKYIPELIPSYKYKLPNISFIDGRNREEIAKIYFEHAKSLYDVVKWKIDDSKTIFKEPDKLPWLSTIGEFLVTKIPRSEKDYEQIEKLGKRFLETNLQIVENLFELPYVKNEVVGGGKQIFIKWQDNIIYRDSSLSIQKFHIKFRTLFNEICSELGLESEFCDALIYSINRPDDDIIECLNDYFDLGIDEKASENEDDIYDNYDPSIYESEERTDEISYGRKESGSISPTSEKEQKSAPTNMGDKASGKRKSSESTKTKSDQSSSATSQLFNEFINDNTISSYDSEQSTDSDDEYNKPTQEYNHDDKRRENISREFESRRNTSRESKNVGVYKQVLYEQNNAERNKLHEYYHGKCQLCGTELRALDGKPLFCATNIYVGKKGKKLPNDLKFTESLCWDSLSLCPNCAAKYRHCTEFPENFKKQIRDKKLASSDEEVTIDIYVNKELQKLHFKHNHFITVQTILKKLLDEEEEQKRLNRKSVEESEDI